MKVRLRSSILTLWVVFAGCGLGAKTPVWQPAPGHKQVAIWPGVVADAGRQPATGLENVTNVIGMTSE